MIAYKLTYGAQTNISQDCKMILFTICLLQRKHGKVIEDKQINKYLREFQTVKDADSRESYKNLKKKIKEQIDWEKPHQSKAQNTLQQNLSHALLPMIAFGVSVPQLQPASSIPNMYWQR